MYEPLLVWTRANITHIIFTLVGMKVVQVSFVSNLNLQTWRKIFNIHVDMDNLNLIVCVDVV